MTTSYEECRALYRSAKQEEQSSQADRRAVRLALAATIATGVHAAAAGVAAAGVTTATAAESGIACGAASASAVGAKGLLSVLLSGHFLGGLLVGVIAGTVVSATAFVVFPASQSPAAAAKTVKPVTAAHTQSVDESKGFAPGLTHTLAPTEKPHAASRKVAFGVAATSTISPPLTAAPRSAAANALPSSLPLPQDQLLDETQALAKVQEALSRNEPDFAWTLLQAQDRQFPQGQLTEERAAAKVLTLCAAGRIPEATQARSRFVATHPNSPLASRVMKGCEH